MNLIASITFPLDIYNVIFYLINSYKIFIFEKSREEKVLLEKLTTELTHKEKEFNKLDERLHVLESNADKDQHFIKQLEEALEIQKSKNNVSFSC